MVADYEQFHDELDKVWSHCFRALVPGGRLVCVVGDVCLSRRRHGRHVVMPMHADIIVRARRIGFDNLSPIFWYKIANANYEVENGSSFLGKPYEPNAIIKNDVEFILMFRKPGGYRHPTDLERRFSVIPSSEHKKWFQQIWSRLPGASTKVHPAPFPEELAMRLIKMFSFVEIGRAHV
jgi:site-specific DNA-methyltransferase (adenine-specific)